MGRSYDERLSERLSGNNDGNSSVLNGNFREWTDHVSANLSYLLPSPDSRYERGLDKKLLEVCKEHAADKQKFEEGENVIMLTHPFHLHLRHMGYIRSDNTRDEVDEYLNKLMGLLNSDRDKSKMGVVVLETVHNYASATSLLLERGLVDKVIFTEDGNGIFLDKNELAEFGDRDVFFAGVYNDQCLGTSIRRMRRNMSSGDIWAIQELVLNSPRRHKRTLKPSSVGEISESRIIGLSEVVEKMK